jgi:hypothetical protein
MPDLHTAYRRNYLNWNENLREYKGQLSADKQVEEVSAASQRVAEYQYQEPEINPGLREFLQAATD